MTETKFTKGEWKITTRENDPDYVGIDSEGHWYEFACVVVGMEGEGPSGEGIANAHLIKTAPKLYEALEKAIADMEMSIELFAFGDSYKQGMTELEYYKQVLAEARGEII